MAASSPPTSRQDIEPLDPLITSIQPGGGMCMQLELWWGSVRRWYLRAFRPAYVARMRSLRQGDRSGCPHEVLDPRDTKYFRNQGGYFWQPHEDPFLWRDRLLLVRVGLGEVVVFGGACVVLALGLAWWRWPLALIPALAGLFLCWFFRNPPRAIPAAAGLVVAPADGTVVTVEETSYEAQIGGPAVTIGIFLSVFNVHINRAPLGARVIGLQYRPGKFLNALRPASARENEQLWVKLEELDPPFRRLVVKQIAGAIARRIVCWARPGEELVRGQQFGMIKLGSRTELVLPREPGLRLHVRPGQRVKAGETILACYPTASGVIP